MINLEDFIKVDLEKGISRIWYSDQVHEARLGQAQNILRVQAHQGISGAAAAEHQRLRNDAAIEQSR
jgi:hypothetical protein